MITRLPTYIINLTKRLDRKRHILNEFKGKKEFEINIISPIKHKIATLSLWITIQHIVRNLIDKEENFFILCEDDHKFADLYSKEHFFHCINEAQEKDADILSGGISWFNSALQISKDLFWVEKFSGLQFTVVFKKFYETILLATFLDADKADYRISELTNNKFFIFPFISTQKEFGYSDVTDSNNEEGFVSRIFDECAQRTQRLIDVSSFFKSTCKMQIEANAADNFENIYFPTYIINLRKRAERLAHIQAEFEGKKEFSTTIIEAYEHKVEAISLWNSIREIIKIAIKNNDDVIILCEEDHQFTEYYTFRFLLQNILEAHYQGADVLSGGAGVFNCAVPITPTRYWVSSIHPTQFIILFKKFFKVILDYSFKKNDVVDSVISKLSANKMLIFPFVSIQKDFGCSDIPAIHNQNSELVRKLFTNSFNQLQNIQNVYTKGINMNSNYDSPKR